MEYEKNSDECLVLIVKLGVSMILYLGFYVSVTITTRGSTTSLSIADLSPDNLN